MEEKYYIYLLIYMLFVNLRGKQGLRVMSTGPQLITVGGDVGQVALNLLNAYLSVIFLSVL